ncbi:MAG TPA: flagellar biosynthesis anti-sigma factor FlgM [Gemmataceae bacterium]|nr:flagellar biosynthesis anti-sigma factor FlgM [Gemmataceae bacterium]
MYRHGPTCLAGPISAARSCWGETFSEPVTDEADSAEIRTELVARVRREIAAGTYDTPEKLEIALYRLLADLGD